MAAKGQAALGQSYIEGLPELKRRFDALAGGTIPRAILVDFGALTTLRAKSLVPVKTANLQRTIRFEVNVAESSVDVTAGGTKKAANQYSRYDASVGYAAFVEFGTAPHIIVPKRARSLAWGGARRLSGSLRSGSSPTHFARVVHHPGTRPHPYLIPAANETLAGLGLASRVITVWNKAA